MNEEILNKIGLKRGDFDENVGSKRELIEAISSSGRLFRKVLQYLIFRDLRTYFKNPTLDFSEGTEKYFPYWGRKKDWSDFRSSMEFNIPRLGTTRLAKLSMIGYLAFYGYGVLHLLSKYTDFLVHASLSGLAFDGLIFKGALLPTIGIFALGQRRLPAKNIEELVDKIIKENMFDFLTSDKEKLVSVLRTELSED